MSNPNDREFEIPEDNNLTPEERAMDGLLQEYKRSGSEHDEALIDRIMSKVKQSNIIEPDLFLFGKGRYWRFAASILLIIFISAVVRTSWLNSRPVSAAEISLFSQEELNPGEDSNFRIHVKNGKTGEPVSSANITVNISRKNGDFNQTEEIKTDENGVAIAKSSIPEDADEGEYTVTVTAETIDGSVDTQKTVQVIRSFRTMLSTDKPLYQPGQVIHMRALTLSQKDLKPSQNQKTIFEVEDSKGNKVFKKFVNHSKFGIASADFKLADQVNTGRYTIRAIVGDTVSERNVNIRHYKLPKYKIQLITDRSYYLPGQTLNLDLKADYTFGKPVANAEVEIVSESFIDRYRPFNTIKGKTKSDGSFSVKIPLNHTFTGNGLRKGDASLRLTAKVKDQAEHEQVTSKTVSVTNQPIRIEVFPESGELVQNVLNNVYILTAYPDGTPAQTTLRIGKDKTEIKSSSAGIAKVKLKPNKTGLQLTVHAIDKLGQKVTKRNILRIGHQRNAFLIRTQKAIYKHGDSIEGEVLSAKNNDLVFIDVVKNQRTVSMHTVKVEDHKGRFFIDIDPTLFGTLEIHAYRLEKNGSITRDTRVVQVVRKNDLMIKAELDKDTYKPAEKALIKFAVTKSNGDPTTAALSIAAVDEAVFALSDMRPGLEELYFLVQQEILKPRYEVHVHPHFDMREAMLKPELDEPLEEASVVLFSAANAKSTPDMKVSESYDVRLAEKRAANNENIGKLQAMGVYTPYILMFISFFPILCYFFWRTRERSTIEGAKPWEIKEFKSYSRRTCWLWVLGVYGPLVTTVIVNLILPYSYRNALLPLYLAALVCFILILSSSQLWKNCKASEKLQGLRRSLSILPYSYLFAWSFILFIGLTSDSYLPYLSLDDVAFHISITAISSAIVFGILSYLRESFLKSFSILKIFLFTLYRIALFSFVPIFSIILFSATGGGGGAGGRSANWGMAVDSKSLGEEVMMKMSGMFDSEMPPTASDIISLPIKEEPGASKPGAKKQPRIRKFFPETLFWQPQLITDDQGKAQLELPLADSITTWRLATSAVSQRGELGSQNQGIRVFQDFFVDIDFPTSLTQNDEVHVPIALYNYLDKKQSIKLDIKVGDGLSAMENNTKTITVQAGEVISTSFHVRAIKPGLHNMTVQAHGEQLSDAVRRSVHIKSDGRAVLTTLNGHLNASIQEKVFIPQDAIQGANDLYVKIYPGRFSQVLEGMDSIFRMPYGCFEQTSSTTYPNILVLDYLRRTKKVKPDIELKALNYINIGYQRLLSYECKGGGFEWFGKNPAHTVLTAYGLLEFNDMAKVYEIDQDVITRTRDWLLEQQNNDGSWQSTDHGIQEGAINAHRNDNLRTTAYIAWAIAESGSGNDSINEAMEYISRNAKHAESNYTLALCANALFAGGFKTEAHQILDSLINKKTENDDEVHWISNGKSLIHSYGKSMNIETTSLSAYAMLKMKKHTDIAHKALSWLIKQKDPNGTWHSTQATVLAMKALLMGTGSDATIDEESNITIQCNGKLIDELNINQENGDVYHLISLREAVQQGENTIELITQNGRNLSYQIVGTHYLPWTFYVNDIKEQPEEIDIDVTYDTQQLQVDEHLVASVSITYQRKGTARMTLVDLGIPPGFSVDTTAFEELKNDRRIERYEVLGRQIILYLDKLKYNQAFKFSYKLKAKYPLKVKTPSSAVYQYYEPEVRAESVPQEIIVE